MTAPILTRLRQQMEQTADPVSRACLAAEMACYLARVGEFGEAEQVRLELRERFGRGSHPRVSIYIIVLESLLLYFGESIPQARDRMLRANALSLACKDQRLIALSSAWLAHIDFNENRFPSMFKALAQGFESLAGDDGNAACRLSLVLGDLFLFGGDGAASQKWYENARLAANRLGDQAAIGAITYNRAALRVSCARVQAVSSAPSPQEARTLAAEVRSAINYQAVARLQSLEHLLGAAHIGALILERDFAAALTAIDKVLSQHVVPESWGELTLLQADRALCLAALGQLDDARAGLTELLKPGAASLGPDDDAVVCACLAQAAVAVGWPDQSLRLQARAQSSLTVHLEQMKALMVQAQPFRDAWLAGG